MKQIKTAEEILKENYLHPLSKTEKYWIVKSMQTYAQQFKPEWTSVEDGLPEVGQQVSICVTGNKANVGYLKTYKSETYWIIQTPDSAYKESPLHSVTHWQPLPSLPNPKPTTK